MNATETIAIDKRKIVRNILLHVLFVSISVVVILHEIWVLGSARGTSLNEFLLFIILTVAWIAITLTPLLYPHWDTIYAFLWRVANLTKLLGRHPGLLIEDSGITDNTSVTACGHIPWEWVTGLEQIDEDPIHGIAVYLSLNHANALIERHSGLKRCLLRLNARVYGTPIFLPADTLALSPDDLYTALVHRYHPFNEHRHKSDAPRPEYLVPYVEKSK